MQLYEIYTNRMNIIEKSIQGGDYKVGKVVDQLSLDQLGNNKTAPMLTMSWWHDKHEDDVYDWGPVIADDNLRLSDLASYFS